MPLSVGKEQLILTAAGFKMASKKLNLIVAMCNNKGIGINGKLPWNLRGDMAFFKKITSETTNPDKRNAVIMGRKTWDSIPQKFRPLANRVNIVISRSLQSVPEGVLVAHDFDQALDLLDRHCDVIENTYVIGGSSVYKMALASPHSHRVYLTRVLADFECDVHMPDLDTCNFKLVTDPRVVAAVQTECEVQYQFLVFEKVAAGDPELNIMVAFVDGSRGFSFQDRLPWPTIKKDVEYYIAKTSETAHPGQKGCWIKGRVSFELAPLEEANRAIVNVVVSASLMREAGAQLETGLHHLVSTMSEALRVVRELGNSVYRVWVMGGQRIYEEALSLPQCTRVYVTRVYTQFPCDRFFPEFEHLFDLASERGVPEGEHAQGDIRFAFQVYHRKSLTL